MPSKKAPAKKRTAKRATPKKVTNQGSENIVPKEVQKEMEKKQEVKKAPVAVSAHVAPSMKRVLYAVDSPALDDRIKSDSLDVFKKVTVLVKDRESKASVEKFLKSATLRLITTFGAQFQDEDFDVAYVEKEMVEYVPANITKKMQ